MKANPILKESNKEEKNYQLNMEILTSLKTLPGKVVNLQSEKIIFNNENINKKGLFPEEKFSTSSSISKEFFCDPFSNNLEKNQKKSYTSNSVFKPIIKKTTMNLYNHGSMMSFSDFLAPNPTILNPLKITNSSFSKNSFYPLMNQDTFLINPINIINNYNINPISSLNPINSINPFTSIFPNYSQIPLINEQVLNKSLSQTKNNIFLNKKRNLDNEANINFNLKENEIKEKESNDIKKNNVIKKTTTKEKSTIFFVKQPKVQTLENPKKNLFMVIPKSNYNYRKRKPRKKKYLNGIKARIYCGHKGCESVFKTKKQLVFHHYKMSPQCHNDTINFLKMIYFTKKILLKNDERKDKLLEKYSELYRNTMKNISLDEHIETIVGLNFEDTLSENS